MASFSDGGPTKASLPLSSESSRRLVFWKTNESG